MKKQNKNKSTRTMIQHTEISLEKKAVRYNGGNNERHRQTDWSWSGYDFFLF